MELSMYVILKALVAAQTEAIAATITLLDCLRQRDDLNAAREARVMKHILHLCNHLPHLKECEDMLTR